MHMSARTSETAVNEQRVFYNGDETGSKFFRIPFLLATENNTLIAGTDVNFGSTGDSAENIDCAIRVKTSASTKSAYEGWSDAQIPSALHMQDYPWYPSACSQPEKPFRKASACSAFRVGWYSYSTMDCFAQPLVRYSHI